MRTIKNKEKIYTFFKALTWGIIFLYPLINSFLGIDLGDTGIHYMNFKYMFSKPEIVGYSSFLTSLVGWSWLQLFGGLGIWGLNFLEVLVEWALALMTYNFLRKYISKGPLLVGITVSVIATGCYLNVFNYHQFSVLLIAGMLYAIFNAVTKNKLLYSILAGVLLGAAVSARISSLACVVCIIIYVFWFFWNDNLRLIDTVKHIASFLLVGLLFCVGMLGVVKTTGIWDAFLNSVFRLGSMATNEGSAYSLERLITDFVYGNIYTVASGILTLASAILFASGMFFVIKYEKKRKRKFIGVFLGIVIIFISTNLAIYSYDINPVNSSPQYTTGPNYMCGILYLAAIIMFLININRDGTNREYGMICMISIFLPLLTVAGSNTQTKHIILSMWFIAPILVDTIFKLFYNKEIFENIVKFSTKIHKKVFYISYYAGLIFMVVIIGYKYLHMIYWTNNFDSVKRWTLTQSVDSQAVKMLKTTSREADSLNSVIKAVNEITDYKKTDSMMVFGQGVMLYELLGEKPLVRPWITNDTYTMLDFQEDIWNAIDDKKELPIVVYCRTNQYFGFEEADYEHQLDMVYGSDYGGKKEVLLKFLEDYNYKLYLEDDYYYVFAPEDSSALGNKYDIYENKF